MPARRDNALSRCHSHRRIRPGDVVRVEIANADDRRGTVTQLCSTRSSVRAQTQRNQRWSALVGVDLETEPGAYQMVDSARTEARRRPRALCVLCRRQFRVRRLHGLARVRRSATGNARADCSSTARRSPNAYATRLAAGSGLDRSCCPSTASRAAISARAATTTASAARLMPVSISRARQARRFAPRITGRSRCAAPLYFTGNTIVIDHGARLFSVFAHLSEFRVKAGDDGRAATPSSGSSARPGASTGPHLHWSVRLNGARVDPLSLVAATAE